MAAAKAGGARESDRARGYVRRVVQLTQLESALLAAAVAGLVATVWLLAERFRLLSQRDLARQRLDDLRADEERLRNSFRSLASETLQQSNAQFLQLAERTLAAQRTEAAADIDRRRNAVDQLVRPIHEVLDKTEQRLREIEKERVSAYSGLRSQISGMQATSAELRAETAKLSRAMGRPSVRGRYGELQLKRVAELAGMQEYCDFDLQTGVRDDHGRLQRPDMVVRLPSGRVLAIDAKMSLDAYLEALAAENDADREIALDRFAENMVRQVNELSRKGYWRQFHESPEFVVMFVPGDQFIDAVLERRPDLVETSARRNVILASPSTLIGLLRAVHVGWREQKLSESAHELFELGHELHERVAVVMGHADKLGEVLEQTVRRYNGLVASVETRLLPTLRKFEERGVRVGDEIRVLKPIDGAVRELSSTTLTPQPAPAPRGPLAAKARQAPDEPAGEPADEPETDPDAKAATAGAASRSGPPAGSRPRRKKRKLRRERDADEPAAWQARTPESAPRRHVRRPDPNAPLLPGFEGGSDFGAGLGQR